MSRLRNAPTPATGLASELRHHNAKLERPKFAYLTGSGSLYIK